MIGTICVKCNKVCQWIDGKGLCDDCKGSKTIEERIEEKREQYAKLLTEEQIVSLLIIEEDEEKKRVR